MSRSGRFAAWRPGGPQDPEGHEPDPRFTFANERTFLAWSRTALALVVAGLGIVQLLPPFPGVPVGRHLLGVPLIVLGAVLAIVAYGEWMRNQRRLSAGLHAGEVPQHVVPGGHWQAAHPATDEEVLVSCVVAPGFDFADFTLYEA